MFRHGSKRESQEVRLGNRGWFSFLAVLVHYIILTQNIVANARVYEPLRLPCVGLAEAGRPAASNGLYTLLAVVYFYFMIIIA
jgi:hypothetical protein